MMVGRWNTLNLFRRYSYMWSFHGNVCDYSLPSASTSLIMSCSSASVGFCPRDLITVPNSLVVMVPSPSLSNRLNASLNSVGKEGHICNTWIIQPDSWTKLPICRQSLTCMCYLLLLILLTCHLNLHLPVNAADYGQRRPITWYEFVCIDFDYHNK